MRHDVEVLRGEAGDVTSQKWANRKLSSRIGEVMEKRTIPNIEVRRLEKLECLRRRGIFGEFPNGTLHLKKL